LLQGPLAREVFAHRPGMGRAIEQLLAFGVCAVNLGVVLLNAEVGRWHLTAVSSGVCEAAQKLGLFLLIAGLAHFTSLFALAGLARAARACAPGD
jgi:hypothetical protein